VWLHFRFPLSLRMVEERLAARGIVVSHGTVWQWALKFGQDFANQIRRKLPRPGDKWHLDEVCLMIGGTKHWLWRAVDQDGVVLDVLVQTLRKGNLVYSPEAAPEIQHIFRVANEWRDLHAYPMERVRAQVIGQLNRLHLRGKLTAARLKRMPSIRTLDAARRWSPGLFHPRKCASKLCIWGMSA